MSWLNLNQSLNSLKGQITNFASEVLSEGAGQEPGDSPSNVDPPVKDLQEKCRNQELEIAALKKLTDELQAALQSERLSRKNGVKEEDSSWYWDPPSQSTPEKEANQYQVQIRTLQEEISALKERDNLDLRQTDTEEELIRLREENKNLTTNLEDLDNQHQLAMERLLTLKKELQKNFEVLKQEHEELKNNNDEYSVEIEQLLAKISERDREIETLKTIKSDYDTLHHKYFNLEKVYSLLRENAEKFQEDNQELHEEVFKLQEQVTKLEHEIEIATKHSELSNTVPRDTYEELVKELTDLKERRSSDRVNLDEINIDDNAKSVIETYKRDIKELKHKLSQKETECQDISDQKIVKTDKIIQLYNKYVNFELPVDYIGEMPSSDDNIVLYKLESVFKTVNSFKKDLDSLNQQVLEKNHNINHLQAQIDDLTTENDFLTTDVQHFEGELNEMKKNNDFLISEITTLKNTSKLEPIIETHEDNLFKLETELDNCNRINKTFESEINRIENELMEVKKEKTLLQESLSDLKNKYTTMLDEFETCRTETKAVEELEHNTNTKYSEKLKLASDEIDDLKTRLNASNAKNEQLCIDLHIVENDKVLLTKEVDDLKYELQVKCTAHNNLESLKLSLDDKLKDVEVNLNEVMASKKLLESEKLKLTEHLSSLKNEFANKSKSVTDVEISKSVTEEPQLFVKLDQTLKENATLSETLGKYSNEIENLKRTEQQLISEKDKLKHVIRTESENKILLYKNIEDLKAKVILLDALNNENLQLKQENQKLNENKLQLETESASTDGKIARLEAEFDMLITDLNEKDSLIDALNATNRQSNTTIASLKQHVSDLEISVETKNNEIERLSQSLKEVTEKLQLTRQSSNLSNDELHRLQVEKEDISKQILNLHEEITSRNMEISTLTNRLEEAEKSCEEYKATCEGKDKEIKELKQSIVEITDKIKTHDNTTHQNDEYAKLVQDKETIDKEVEVKSEHLEKTCLEYKTVIDNATKEKAELINLINLKHNESIQYHNEIQRLNHVLLEQTNEYKRVVEEKSELIQNSSKSCSNCERLRITLKEKDEIIMRVTQNMTNYETVMAELSNATDTVRSLKERCENLDKSMAIQLETVKKLTAENVQLSEQEQNSSRELERLRQHLMETEENYTQELMTTEQKLTECTTRLHQVEERAKQTSTVYTSNSIRANQEVETYRNQIKLLEKQREEVQARLGEAEDARSRSEAALTNLQVVLEQFQLDKERDIHTATEKMRNKMEELRRENFGLTDEIARLNAKLEESLAGLQAATRLGDQVETKTAQINDLKEQVRTLQTSVAAAEERYYNATSNQQDKVDKNLVKNLIINYVMTAQNSLNKTQVLRILSTVLDFNQQECEKLGLARSATQPDSLAAEFVRFLQSESAPRAALPSMMDIALPSRSATPASRRSSTLGPPPAFEASHKRHPSTGSNNLLFQNIDAVETSSQISIESETQNRVGMDTGVSQPRNTEGAILKYVLKDM